MDVPTYSYGKILRTQESQTSRRKRQVQDPTNVLCVRSSAFTREMSGFVPLLFPLVLSVLGAALFETVSAEKASRFEHGNFVTHKNRALNVTNITAWVVVSDELECLFACITTPPCLSVNLASLGGGEDQSLKCDLLATDKYAHPEKLLESQQTHHYSKYVSRANLPCCT